MNKIPKKKDRPGVDHYGRNDLINHVRANDLKNVQIFINSGIDINQCDDNKWTALHFACQNVSEKMIELLLKNGANPNVRDIDGNTPLSKALFNIRDMDSIAIQLLKDSGADPYIKNNYGVSSIDLANTVANYDLKKFFPEEFNNK